jgi:hypothetical protein
VISPLGNERYYQAPALEGWKSVGPSRSAKNGYVDVLQKFQAGIGNPDHGLPPKADHSGLLEQLPVCFSPVGLLQSGNGCRFVIPSYSVPNPLPSRCMILNFVIEPWCQYSIFRKTDSKSSATEHLPKPVSVIEIVLGVM